MADNTKSTLIRRELLSSAIKAGVGAALINPLLKGGTVLASSEKPPKEVESVGYCANDSKSPLRRFDFYRRGVGPTDVRFDILYCGVCHSDIHTARDEWLGTVYPCVPGHEIVGKVTEVGEKVSKVKVGDAVAVGCMVDSCQHCASCAAGLEQYCENKATFTYNSPDKSTGKTTYGGYSNAIVVTEKFIVKIPGNLDLKRAAPLLCAGITTYSPMRHWKVRPGQKVGIVGIGGLGHIAVKIASALGANTFAITTSPGKVIDARRLGAEGAILFQDSQIMKAHENTFDFILSTIPQANDLNPYVALLKRDGILVVVGALDAKASNLVAAPLIVQRKSVVGSLIGGIAETQEVVDFCGKNGILADIELIPIQKINEAFERVVKKDVRYRFVIDMTSLKA